MREWIYDSYHGVMNLQYNPLRHVPDEALRHAIMQILAWMWCIVFSLYMGSYFVFGVSAVAHIAFIIALSITIITFKKAESFKHPSGTFDYEKAQGRYEDIW